MASFDLSLLGSDLTEIRRDVSKEFGIEYCEKNFSRLDSLILKTWSRLDLIEFARQNGEPGFERFFWENKKALYEKKLKEQEIQKRDLQARLDRFEAREKCTEVRGNTSIRSTLVTASLLIGALLIRKRF
jgi:hypothetical protein